MTLAVTWNTSALSDDVDTVNVVIFRYYENIPTSTISFAEVVTLAKEVPFSDGRVEFSRPEVDLSTADMNVFGFIAVKEANPQHG